MARDHAVHQLQHRRDQIGLRGQWAGKGRLQAVPSMAVTLSWLPFWQDNPLLAIDWARIVRGDGGCGSWGGAREPLAPLPDGPATASETGQR